jgi:predicted thioredoxin/glutaredoxin
VNIVLVTRRGCHLCDEALGHLKELGYDPEPADVDADSELFRLYDWRVPVVLVDGRPLIEGHITRDRLEAALNGSGGVGTLPELPTLWSR